MISIRDSAVESNWSSGNQDLKLRLDREAGDLLLSIIDGTTSKPIYLNSFNLFSFSAESHKT